MKEDLSQLSLNSTKIHVPTCDCDIDGGSDSPLPDHQDLPPAPDSKLHADL